MTVNIRKSSDMEKNGYIIFPFPGELAKAMKSHIFQFMGIQIDGLNETEALKKCAEISLNYSDEDFVKKFAKPFRMFPDSVAELAVNWISSLRDHFGGTRTGVNYACKEERDINYALREDSYDVFWRCVRPGKPDVGAAHCDYQFWEIAKGTSAEVGSSFDYDERWKMWVPLLGCDKTNSLQIVPGSHLQIVPTDRVLTKNGYKPVIQPSWLEKHEKMFLCPLKNFDGYCVLFHDKLVHRGPLNNTSTLRLSGELTILLKL